MNYKTRTLFGLGVSRVPDTLRCPDTNATPTLMITLNYYRCRRVSVVSGVSVQAS
jgi:hypothetical protein